MAIIKALIEKHYDSIVNLRRHFHIHPELSAQEFNTQQKIMDELLALGLQPKKIANTGVIADLQGKLPGKTVAIRADIDALELQDECNQPYQSQNPGVCHACGHDGHTAMLIGVAKTLVELKNEFSGTIRLLFQPSEERFPGGAEMMIADGALVGVDCIIGTHLWQTLEVGTIGITYGPMMASPDEFTIKIKGRGGHASMPHQTVDALLVGAQIAVALNTIVSRNVDPMEQAVISLGFFKAGDTFNIIPDTAILNGTVRSFNETMRTALFDRIEQVTMGLCQAAGATFTFDKHLGFLPVINHPDISKVLADAGAESLGSEKVLTINPVMGGEDFSQYLEKVPGAFMFVGIGNEKKGIIYPQHHPKFDMDEKALFHGVEIMTRAALTLLK
ncbi:M20 family metallopeptidase [Pelosinus sp. sgz500959]|uniref:M20 metallopeptidase family protein n=1 Tax=Pelosinus sp. sgz500959 TaxID=3242472 RepID=UPI00366EE1DB